QDALRPGAPVPEGSERVRLSAHDLGRVAEVEVLTARLQAAQERNAPGAEIEAIWHEVDLTMAALGRTGAEPGTRARARTVLNELAANPEARRLVATLS